MTYLAQNPCANYDCSDTLMGRTSLDHHDELSIIEASKGMPKQRPQPKQPMSRETQTQWIVGAIAVLAVFVLAIGLKIANEDPRYPGCTGYFGIEDKECISEAAFRRLRGGY